MTIELSSGELRLVPVDHCYRHGHVHSDVMRSAPNWDGRCWDLDTSLDHPWELSVVIGQVAVPAINELIGEGCYARRWADWQLDLVKAFVSRLNDLIDHEEKARNRPDALAGTGPAPRATHTPANEGSGHE